MGKEIDSLKRLSPEQRAKKIRELLSEKTKKELQALEEVTLLELKEKREEEKKQEDSEDTREKVEKREEEQSIEERLADAPKNESKEPERVYSSNRNEATYSSVSSYEGAPERRSENSQHYDSSRPFDDSKKKEKGSGFGYNSGPSQFD